MHAIADPLFGYRMRNDAFDCFYYDIDAIADGTVARAAELAEGGIIVVQPGPDDGFAFYADAEAFLKSTARPRTVAVAGVGSSAIGTAALAKNVAEAVQAPVAGVVTGYGAHDVLWEALGGWFWFRRLNRIHHWWDETSAQVRADHLFAAANVLSPDTKTLTELFSQPVPAFDVIVGHSKGNLSIAEALYAAQAEAPTAAAALLAHAHIVTISAAIYMPKGAYVTDAIGTRDLFGKMNSDPRVEAEIKVPDAGHHTGRAWFPESRLDVTAVVVEALTKYGRMV
jgi:hypothetical protein